MIILLCPTLRPRDAKTLLIVFRIANPFEYSVRNHSFIIITTSTLDKNYMLAELRHSILTKLIELCTVFVGVTLVVLVKQTHNSNLVIT